LSEGGEISSEGETAPSAGSEEPNRGFSEGYRRYALGLLLTVYIFNFIDRQILSILLESIKRDLSLSDTQLGFLSGIAFAIFYSTLGIPIARWADRGSRRTIIALALAVWSVMTAVSGLARGFGTLALARIGVGIGEAGCSPPAHSLLSDYYPPERRATALSIYALGIPVGVLFGYLIGGQMDEYFGWRTAFLVVGLPGLLLSIVVRFTLKDPPRGQWDAASASREQLPVGEAFAYLWSRRSFRHLSFAAALHAFVGYGVGTWHAPFLMRIHGMSSSEVGTWLALLAGLAGGLGTFLGGYVTDRLRERDVRYYVWVPGVSTIASIPLVVGFYLWPTPYVALGFLILPAILGSMYLGPTFAVTQSLVGPSMRAMASAILLFIINLIGLGLGPQAVGLLSDLLVGVAGHESLRYALLSVALVNVWSTIHYFLAARSLSEDLERVNDA